MSGVKHTPWEVEDCGSPEYLDGIRSRYAVRNKSGQPIAYAFEADEARLIAAAPDLLEALSRAAHSYDGVPPRHCPAWMDQALAAISRARGEQSPNHSDTGAQP